MKSRFAEDSNNDIKLAVLVGILPKGYQDIVLQTTSVTDKVQYENIRDNIVNMANQKVEILQPRPKDIRTTGREDEYKREREEDTDAGGKVEGPVTCYKYLGKGHISKECPSDRNGKGSPKGQQQYGKGYDYKGWKREIVKVMGKGSIQKETERALKERVGVVRKQDIGQISVGAMRV